MEREAALGLMRRAVDIGVKVWPEMAERHMEVPLDYFTDPAIFASEKALSDETIEALGEAVKAYKHQAGFGSADAAAADAADAEAEEPAGEDAA